MVTRERDCCKASSISIFLLRPLGGGAGPSGACAVEPTGLWAGAAVAGGYVLSTCFNLRMPGMMVATVWFERMKRQGQL